eukprot:scaffold17676_cov18-Tisochrysis_lutea.AAC.2
MRAFAAASSFRCGFGGNARESIAVAQHSNGAERGHVFRFSHEDVKGAKEQGQDKEDEEGKDTPSAFVGSRNQLMHGIRAAQH